MAKPCVIRHACLLSWNFHMTHHFVARITLAFLSSLLLAGTGQAQDFPPKKPITLTVGLQPVALPTRRPG